MTDKEIIDGLYEIKNWKCNGDSKMHSIICGAIDLLEQTRWTLVSELPKEQIKIGEYVFSENVLGTEGHTIRKAYYNYTTKEWFDGNEEMVWTEITHWMPLPEKLPKAESEDKE